MLIVKDEPEIEKTLSLLYPQCVENGAECIVVDASQGRLDYIRDKNPWVTWIAYNQPAGRVFTIPHQRNLCVAAARANVLLFCDAGGSPDRHWVAQLSAPLLSGRENLVGGPISNTNAAAAVLGENLQPDGEVLKVSTTANIGFTRGAYQLAGGFNETLNYGSDADFIWTLEREGIFHINVADAVMGLDGGGRRREQKRSWRYGKAIVDLLILHPEKRKKKLMRSPELVAYGVLAFAWIISILLAWNIPYLVIFPLASTIALLIRNRHDNHPIDTVLNHYIYSLGSIWRVINRGAKGFRLKPVLLYPSAPTKYTEKLLKSVNSLGAIAQFMPTRTPSATWGIILLPFRSPSLRLRGVRVIHIHWVYEFGLHWARSKFARTLIQFWFYLWINGLRLLQIKIVYTKHNELPHQSIFGDDQLAMSFLHAHSDVIVVLNELSRSKVVDLKPVQMLELIPEGPLLIPSTESRDKMREKLRVNSANKLVILTGNLQPYKGVHKLVEGLAPRNFSVRIAGAASAEYQAKLASIANPLSAKGIDIELSFGRLSENEYGGYLKAADYFCVPFDEINNSGSLNAALSAGLPVIIPQIPELNWVPTDAAIYLKHNKSEDYDFEGLFQELLKIDDDRYESMRSAALAWSKSLSWEDAGQSHAHIYRSLL